MPRGAITATLTLFACTALLAVPAVAAASSSTGYETSSGFPCFPTGEEQLTGAEPCVFTGGSGSAESSAATSIKALSDEAFAAEDLANATSESGEAEMTEVGYQSVEPGPGKSAIVTLTNGAEFKVSRKLAEKIPSENIRANAASPPPNTVYGNCGNSDLYLYNDGNNSGVKVLTGYSVYASVTGPIIGSVWQIDGGNYTYGRYFGHVYASHDTYSWHDEHYRAILGGGNYIAGVTFGMVLGYRDVCYAGDPVGTAHIP